MSNATLYHNPRCSKSRGALELLQAQGIEPVIVRYLDTPPTTTELSALLQQLGLTARQLLRTGEDEYRQLNLADESLSEDQLISIMCQHPKLIERPIFIYGQRAVVGRPPERVLELLA